jgi:segregation and condensation protein A
MAVGTFHVSLSSFEGPFDLLLHLIARHRVDVHAIPIAQITDEYLAVLRGAETVDLEVATDFLVVAATLVELKAARLLPNEDDPELDELAVEVRDLLYARLLDYRTFKHAAAWIDERLEAGRGSWPRMAALEERFARLRPDVVLPVDGPGLAALAATAIASAPHHEVDLTHVQPIRMTVREAVAHVLGGLRRAGGRASFRALTASCRDRIEIVVSFLALLELYRVDVVELEQTGTFGDLQVAWIGETPPTADAVPMLLTSGGEG